MPFRIASAPVPDRKKYQRRMLPSRRCRKCVRQEGIPLPDALIHDAGGNAEVLTDERCYIRELLNDPRVPETSLALARVDPGVTTKWHRVSVHEWYVIKEGRGRMWVGDQPPFDVGPGDSVSIPPGTPQRIENIGAGSLAFHCICQPRFRDKVYESLE